MLPKKIDIKKRFSASIAVWLQAETRLVAASAMKNIGGRAWLAMCTDVMDAQERVLHDLRELCE